MAKRKEPTKNDRNNEGEDHEDDDSGSEVCLHPLILSVPSKVY
jgi:hypothetical protein